jgi:hypothetical protein
LIAIVPGSNIRDITPKNTNTGHKNTDTPKNAPKNAKRKNTMVSIKNVTNGAGDPEYSYVSVF